jgi:hypothetical protein
VDLPIPRTFPPIMSGLKGKSDGSSLVVAITRASSGLGAPGRLMETAPVVEWRAGMNWPVVLWLSAGGTRFSFYWDCVSKMRLRACVRPRTFVAYCCMFFQFQPGSPVTAAYLSKSSEEPRWYAMKSAVWE